MSREKKKGRKRELSSDDDAYEIPSDDEKGTDLYIPAKAAAPSTHLSQTLNPHDNGPPKCRG